MINSQALLFLVFILNGIIIGLIFDFFRILRKSFKTTNIITYIHDILFWILAGISIIFCMYKFSDGEMRFFMFLGIIFGFLLYMLMFSQYIIKLFVFIIKYVKNIIYLAMKAIIFPLKKIHIFFKIFIFQPVYIFMLKRQKFPKKMT